MRLEQVVVNLLTNAAKYTDAGGRIWLAARREGGRGRSSRSGDTGIGIPPELLPRVFDLFAQGTGRSPARGGARDRPDRWCRGWSRCTAAASPPAATGPARAASSPCAARADGRRPEQAAAGRHGGRGVAAGGRARPGRGRQPRPGPGAGAAAAAARARGPGGPRRARRDRGRRAHAARGRPLDIGLPAMISDPAAASSARSR